MKKLSLFSLFFFFFISVTAFPMLEKEMVVKKSIVNRLAQASDILPREYLEAVFANPLLRVDSVMIRDLKKRTSYLSTFLDSLFSPWSVARGKWFLEQYKDTLRNIRDRFGISPEMTTAMLRIESDLGENLGKYIAMNAYYTLYTKVYYSSRRRALVLRELRALLEFCYKTFPHPSFPYFFRSSWAGAIGYCQFMPSNFGLAVDGDADDVINIAESIPDALASAANFLEANGYRRRPQIAVLRYIGGSMRTSGWYVLAVFKYARLVK